MVQTLDKCIIIIVPPTSNDTDLNEWELRILSALKSSSKTERRICKEVKLNASIVSELITALIEKGLISRYSKTKVALLFFRVLFNDS